MRREPRPDLAISRRTAIRPSHQEPCMADVLYVVLTIATFAVLALVIKGVEHLER
jgi:hypothetical protein